MSLMTELTNCQSTFFALFFLLWEFSLPWALLSYVCGDNSLVPVLKHSFSKVELN